MSAVDERQVTFAGYSYRLEPLCASHERIEQTCIGGAQRRCERCTRVWLKPRAEHMGWGSTTVTVGRADPGPVDCTQACPADEWGPLLPRLAAVLKGRELSGVLAGTRPVVFRSAKGCARELQRRKSRARAADRE